MYSALVETNCCLDKSSMSGVACMPRWLRHAFQLDNFSSLDAIISYRIVTSQCGTMKYKIMSTEIKATTAPHTYIHTVLIYGQCPQEVQYIFIHTYIHTLRIIYAYGSCYKHNIERYSRISYRDIHTCIHKYIHTYIGSYIQHHTWRVNLPAARAA